MEINKWDDLPYNFLIGDNGYVYEGRGWNREGAHRSGFNRQSIGITFIGRFDSKLPSERALKIAQELIQCGVNDGELRGSYSLISPIHWNITNNILYNEITKWRNFVANPKAIVEPK